MSHIRKTQAQNSWYFPNFDPNPTIGPRETIGSLNGGGDYQAIRYSDPVIAPMLSYVRKHLENLVWICEPKDSSYESQAAAELTEEFIKSLEWGRWTAQVWDLTHTFGFVYYERIWCEDSNTVLGINVKLFPLFPPTISRIETTPDGIQTSKVEQLVDVGSQMFSGNELIHYVPNTDIPGNLTGISALRPLIFPHRASQIDSKVYLDARTRSAGTIVLNMNDGTERGSQEFEEILSSLDSVISGQSGYLVLPPGVDSKMLSNNNPPDGALENWKYYDALKRAALGSYLENLGLNGAGSNRALGEVLQDADNERWQAQLRSFENLMNEQGLIPEFFEIMNIPREYQPRLCIFKEEEVTDLDEVLKRLNELADLQEFLDEAEFRKLKAEILEGRQ